MPVYDCGAPNCEECAREFGPDRTAAIANYRKRDAAMAKYQMRQAAPIVTSHLRPPIPTRSYDWCAYRDGQEEAGSYGWGATEAAAIADLIDNVEAA